MAAIPLSQSPLIKELLRRILALELKMSILEDTIEEGGGGTPDPTSNIILMWSAMQ
ncbi:MAG TPA: hypothetical protein VF638_14300 [Sphingomonas sp.]|jgi:hypothetical protein